MKEIALLVSDTHLSPKTIEINRSIWKQMVSHCKKRGLKKIYHLGDVFDSRKSQTEEMLLVLDELLSMVFEAGIDITIIPGNHDKTSYQSEDSFLHVYRHHPQVNLVRRYLKEIHGGLQIFLCPFFDEKSGKYHEVLSELVEDVVPPNKSVLLTHIGINGAMMNSGKAIENNLEVNAFKMFTKVYVGHYHDHQEFDNIVYLGSAFQSNYGENNRKGFNILRSDGSIEFIKSTFPEYKKVIVDINTATKKDLDSLKKEHQASSDNIRFVFKGDKEKIAKVDKNEFMTLGIDVKTEEADSKVTDYSEIHVTSFDENAIREEWDEFAGSNKEIHQQGVEYLEKSLC